jgi:hypothetical protein
MQVGLSMQGAVITICALCVGLFEGPFCGFQSRRSWPSATLIVAAFRARFDATVVIRQM